MRKKISKPGQYSGYSELIYTEVIRTSFYLQVRGNRLAIDIYRPAKNGVMVDEPYPAILQNKRYQRRGELERDLDFIEYWVRHGYIVAVLDPRGAGASFGYRKGEWSWEEALDGREVIEWLAAQPYCAGKVGMWGFSYMGGIQYMIAATKPPHLKAIVPHVATIDQFFRCPNGVVWTPPEPPISIQKPLDMAGLTAEPPQNVDDDLDGTLLSSAVAQHEANVYSDQMWTPHETYRNQYKPEIDGMNFIKQSAITYRNEIEASKVAIYNINGWYDAAPAQALAAWKLWGGKVIIGPWNHDDLTEMMKIEHLRWFDFHLKGIDNGIMDEPPIYYLTFNAPAKQQWQFTPTWPLPNQRVSRYHFSGVKSGTSSSINDGSLTPVAPEEAEAKDHYHVDYSIKVFEENGEDKFRPNERCWNGDMEKSTGSKGLTYTSTRLTSNLQITGIPVLHLWVSSSSADGYFFAFLEEVDSRTNISKYVSNGMIKASFRNLSTQFPWADLGIPYHRCFAEDSQPLERNRPEELVFDFYPTSYIFQRGNRIRVTITGSLQSNYSGMAEDPPPLVVVYRDLNHPSYIELPVTPGS
jgi:putative CocE/NonD family hydrolase